MGNSVTSVMEITVGGLLVICGIIYLSMQSRNLEQFTSITMSNIIEDENIFQLYHDFDRNSITSDELYAVLIGYREYPIVIDGITIRTDGCDLEYYTSLIQAGRYKKEYQYDSNSKIELIRYSYLGPI